MANVTNTLNYCDTKDKHKIPGEMKWSDAMLIRQDVHDQSVKN